MKKTLILLLLSSIEFAGCNTSKKEELVDVETLLPEDHQRINRVKGFRKYDLGSDISNFPELKRIPAYDSKSEEYDYPVLAYYNPKENLKIGDLPVDSIWYSFYKGKLYKIQMQMKEGAEAEMKKTLLNLYPVDGDTTYGVFQFHNQKVTIFYESGFLMYYSPIVRAKMELDDSLLKSKTINNRAKDL
jgi:hypothetical protein